MRKNDCIVMSTFFKLLAHPVRIGIICELRSKDLCVKDLMKNLNVRQSLISQQLTLLRMSGIVKFIQKGTTKTYLLANPTLINEMFTLITKYEKSLLL